MGGRRVLLLDANGLIAYRCGDGAAVVEERFRRGDEERFDGYLKRNTRCVYDLLVDLCDESFELEHLPHVWGPSRDAMLKRKREQRCHGGSLCIALDQGRQSDGRRDDRFLFAGLTRPQFIDPWLDSLERASTPLRGIHSVAQLAAVVAASSSRKSFLLATLGRAGLRQTFIENGRLRFSRLTALAGAGIPDAAAACAAEAVNLRRYLCGQRLMDRSESLPVVVLLHTAQTGSFREHCRDDAELSFEYLDIEAEARRQRLSSPLPDSFADPLFAHMLARNPPRPQFAPAEMRRHWQFQRLCRALDGAGAIALFVSLAIAAIQLPGSLDVREATEQLRAQNDFQERQASEPPLSSEGLPQRDLRDLAVGMEALERISPGPEPLLHRLSRELEDFGAIELDAIEWRLVGEFDSARRPFAILDVRGWIAGDRDADRRSIEQLAARLRAAPSMNLRVLKQPFSIESSEALRSADQPGKDGAFVLRLAQAL